MHEFSVTRSLVELLKQEADKNNLKTVKRINIRLGKFTGFSPDSIRFYFDILKPDSCLQEAELNFKEEPIIIKCDNCKKEIQIEEPIMICPECGNPEIELLSGREFFVESIEGE
jgi:hydrogenase nickel incorporation protein HypA/HybF